MESHPQLNLTTNHSITPMQSDLTNLQNSPSSFNEFDQHSASTRNQDDCELPQLTPPSLPIINRQFPTLSQMTTAEILQEIRAARQVIADSTTQRNAVLELLTHLEEAQRELATEAQGVNSPSPTIPSRQSLSLTWRESDQTINQDSSLTLTAPLQISVLSRLARLSRRTRQVMQDLNHRRHIVDFAVANPLTQPSLSINQPSSTQSQSQPQSENQFQSQSENQSQASSVSLLKPMRKVRLEERLLVEWCPQEHTLYRTQLPLGFHSKQVFRRSSNGELACR
ncbi:hypothetical protein O181_049644 [Austropuccinia psidii MF-1]|uniref:Uncharacterized protein n=1 Tax=Austropuccinia psidii MF-1 TaxID=1389203 RepID=A0A9Q3DV84_9BASI|nr:hypothetical protein [Austropuccinia psidii MF-1]